MAIPSLSVLVVEDDAALRTLFLALLTRQGFRPQCVNDGEQALNVLARGACDVLLLDLMMPVTNGFDVLRRLRAVAPGLLRRTIVITGVSQQELEKVDAKSIFAILRKPFDVPVLLETIERCAQTSPAPGRADLEAPVRKFEAAVPELKKVLGCEATSKTELLLRHELRRAVDELGGAFDAAARVQDDPTRAERYARLGRTAAGLASTISSPQHREH